MEKNPGLRKMKLWIAAGAAAGLGLGLTGIASAATGDNTTDTTTAPAVQAPAQAQQAPNPADMKNGPGEELLTGTTADKVEAAAKAAEPGATVIRVETDSAGHTYEAHVTLADGTEKTLYFTADFKADGSDTGFGGGPHGGPQGAQQGFAPQQDSATSTTN